jgi:Lon protease-like protein
MESLRFLELRELAQRLGLDFFDVIFEVAEKQALLEAEDADARTKTLIALLEMSALTGKAVPEGVRH